MESAVTMPDRIGTWTVALLILIVPLVATLSASSAPASAQYGPEPDTPPYITVHRSTCPDDIGVGDNLDERCDAVMDDEELTIDGGVPSSSQPLTNGFASFSDLPRDQTYSISSSAIGDDRASLITCNPSLGETSLGYGGIPGLPVTLDAFSSFTIDLMAHEDVDGQGANCHWFDVPAASFGDGPAGLIVYDEDRAVGSMTSRDLVLTSEALDEPLAIDTSNPNGVPSGPIVTGPIILPAGEYSFEDRASGFSTELTLEPGQILTPDETVERTAPPEEPGATIGFPGTNLDGAYTDLDSDLYGDEAAALYGADSGNASGTLTFDAPAPDASTDATLTLLGLDDELTASARISVLVNGTELYTGNSTFPAWDPNATGNQWGELTLDIDRDLLADTDNDLVITNLSAGSDVGTPPWVMITRITIAQ